MKQSFYKGAMGNSSLHTVTVALAALAAGATKVLEEAVPVGTQITGIRVVTAGSLGANTAVKVDVVDKEDNDTAVLASTASTSALSLIKPLKPIYVGNEGESSLVLTNSGTGAATGEVTVQLEYNYKGY